jgi:hypothetical protein
VTLPNPRRLIRSVRLRTDALATELRPIREKMAGAVGIEPTTSVHFATHLDRIGTAILKLR